MLHVVRHFSSRIMVTISLSALWITIISDRGHSLEKQKKKLVTAKFHGMNRNVDSVRQSSQSYLFLFLTTISSGFTHSQFPNCMLRTSFVRRWFMCVWPPISRYTYVISSLFLQSPFSADVAEAPSFFCRHLISCCLPPSFQ